MKSEISCTKNPALQAWVNSLKGFASDMRRVPLKSKGPLPPGELVSSTKAPALLLGSRSANHLMLEGGLPNAPGSWLRTARCVQMGIPPLPPPWKLSPANFGQTGPLTASVGKDPLTTSRMEGQTGFGVNLLRVPNHGMWNHVADQNLNKKGTISSGGCHLTLSIGTPAILPNRDLQGDYNAASDGQNTRHPFWQTSRE